VIVAYSKLQINEGKAKKRNKVYFLPCRADVTGVSSSTGITSLSGTSGTYGMTAKMSKIFAIFPAVSQCVDFHWFLRQAKQKRRF